MDAEDFAEDLRVWNSNVQALDEVWRAGGWERQHQEVLARLAFEALSASDHGVVQEENTKAVQA